MQRKYKIAMLIAIWIAIILIVGNVAWQLFMKEKKEENKSYLSISKTEYGDWVIKIQNLKYKIDISEIEWSILKEDKFLVVITEDTDIIYDYGKIGVNISYWNITHDTGGYMRTDNGYPITNATEYWENYATKSNVYRGLSNKSIVVFMNNDEEKETRWKISNGDEYYIRSPLNYDANFIGQKIYKGYWFRLGFASADEMLAMIQLT